MKVKFDIYETQTNLRLARNKKTFLWTVPKAGGPSAIDRKIMEKVKKMFEKNAI